MRIVLTLIAGLLLSGCIASGPSFQPEAFVPPNKSVVYAYRPMGLVGIGECYRVYVDDKKLGCIKAGGYFRYDVEPGRHTVGVAGAINSPTGVEMFDTSVVEMQGGRPYYFEVTMNSLDEVSENQALIAIGKTRQQQVAAR